VVVEDAEYTAMTPANRPARITVRFLDGSERQHAVMGSKGDPDQPMSEAELEAKFLSLVEPGLGSEKAAIAWDHLGNISEAANLGDIAQILTPSTK